MNFQKNFLYNLFYFSLFIAIAFSIQYVVNTTITESMSMTVSYSEQDDIQNIDRLGTLPCDVIFDVHKFGFCIDMPLYYHVQNPAIFNRVIYYFNIVPLINYSKIHTCKIDDLILYINKLDTRYMDSFTIIS